MKQKGIEIEQIKTVLDGNRYPEELLKKQKRTVFRKNPREDKSLTGDNDRKKPVALQSVKVKPKRVSHKYNFIVAERPVAKSKSVMTNVFLVLYTHLSFVRNEKTFELKRFERLYFH